jgi:hypothetical protein
MAPPEFPPVSLLRFRRIGGCLLIVVMRFESFLPSRRVECTNCVFSGYGVTIIGLSPRWMSTEQLSPDMPQYLVAKFLASV